MRKDGLKMLAKKVQCLIASSLMAGAFMIEQEPFQSLGAIGAGRLSAKLMSEGFPGLLRDIRDAARCVYFI